MSIVRAVRRAGRVTAGLLAAVLLTVVVTVVLAAAGPAAAQDLRIAVAAEATSLDPHFHNLAPNNALRRHVFEALVSTDERQQLVPGLAVSWQPRDERTWEFKLRPNVRFSNGVAFTARDVVYTLCRVPAVENSPASFAVFTRGIEAIETPDPLTLVVRTAGPLPLLPTNLANIGIISAEAFGGSAVVHTPSGCQNLGPLPKSADFNDPAKAIGTGPYRLAGYARGASVTLERNEGYWGEAPRWRTVTYRPIPADAARVAALLGGEVDGIEAPPIADFPRLREAGFEIVCGTSNRVIYLAMDQYRGDPAWRTPGVRGTDRNPFLDRRVREAVSKAIDREAIVAQIMGGAARPAGELLPVPLFGTSPERRADAYDPDRARQLLAEAGYADGFEVTLGAPNDRYTGDERIARAVAAMLGRVGIRAPVDAMTASTFFTRRNKNEFSLYLSGWGGDSGEMSATLNALLLTPNPQAGYGAANRGRYANPALDAVVVEAQRTVDEARRAALLRKASRIAMEDYAVIPLHFEVAAWAFRKGFTARPRLDQSTLAMDVRPTGS